MASLQAAEARWCRDADGALSSTRADDIFNLQRREHAGRLRVLEREGVARVAAEQNVRKVGAPQQLPRRVEAEQLLHAEGQVGVRRRLRRGAWWSKVEGKRIFGRRPRRAAEATAGLQAAQAALCGV